MELKKTFLKLTHRSWFPLDVLKNIVESVICSYAFLIFKNNNDKNWSNKIRRWSLLKNEYTVNYLILFVFITGNGTRLVQIIALKKIKAIKFVEIQHLWLNTLVLANILMWMKEVNIRVCLIVLEEIVIKKKMNVEKVVHVAELNYD